jgi:hypothetical protein
LRKRLFRICTRSSFNRLPCEAQLVCFITGKQIVASEIHVIHEKEAMVFTAISVVIAQTFEARRSLSLPIDSHRLQSNQRLPSRDRKGAVPKSTASQFTVPATTAFHKTA